MSRALGLFDLYPQLNDTANDIAWTGVFVFAAFILLELVLHTAKRDGIF